MQVSVVYFQSCPSWREAGSRLRLALDRLGRHDVTISYVPVATEAQAAAAGFRGSPTILIDGADLFPGAPAPSGLTCRIYATAEGLAGAPELAALTSALESRMN